MDLKNCAAALTLLLAGGCGGGFSLWPFGQSGPREIAAKPANATEYRCDGGRRFFVRGVEGGALWLIAPDREIRLGKLPGEGRYGAGKVLLEISGPAATLTDPPAQFAGCKSTT